MTLYKSVKSGHGIDNYTEIADINLCVLCPFYNFKIANVLSGLALIDFVPSWSKQTKEGRGIQSCGKSLRKLYAAGNKVCNIAICL